MHALPICIMDDSIMENFDLNFIQHPSQNPKSDMLSFRFVAQLHSAHV